MYYGHVKKNTKIEIKIQKNPNPQVPNLTRKANGADWGFKNPTCSRFRYYA